MNVQCQSLLYFGEVDVNAVDVFFFLTLCAFVSSRIKVFLLFVV